MSDPDDVTTGDLDYRHNAAFGRHVEDTLGQFAVSTDPHDFGATHRLRFEDGTEELMHLDGGAVLEGPP